MRKELVLVGCLTLVFTSFALAQIDLQKDRQDLRQDRRAK